MDAIECLVQTLQYEISAAKYIEEHFNAKDITTTLNSILPKQLFRRVEWIDLLTAMFHFDPEQRITAGQILAHPVIVAGALCVALCV